MGRAEQTLESIQADFDRIALLSDEAWNHNTHYHDYLIRQIPERCDRVLEIGCGMGEFSRLLAQRARNVLAIDLSPQMIRLAREQSIRHPNIEFAVCDAMTFNFGEQQFDCIATLTTIHHLPIQAVLHRIRAALKPGGVFFCLDLYQNSRAMDLVFDGFAYSTSLLLRLIKTGRLRPQRASLSVRGAREDRYL